MIQAQPIDVSVILPAHNESTAVHAALTRYTAALDDCCESYEIIVVNDASTDDTLAVVEQSARENSRIQVVDNERNIGQGGSIVQGFLASRGDVVMHNGVDLPFEPNETRKVLAQIQAGADVVVIERPDRRAYGVVRKVLSWGNIVMLKLLLGSKFTDHNFVQAYRRHVIEQIEVETRGVSTVTPELILKAQAAGFRVDSLTIGYNARAAGRTTITLRKVVHTTLQLIRLAMILRWPKRSRARRSGTLTQQGV